MAMKDLDLPIAMVEKRNNWRTQTMWMITRNDLLVHVAEANLLNGLNKIIFTIKFVKIYEIYITRNWIECEAGISYTHDGCT